MIQELAAGGLHESADDALLVWMSLGPERKVDESVWFEIGCMAVQAMQQMGQANGPLGQPTHQQQQQQMAQHGFASQGFQQKAQEAPGEWCRMLLEQ